MNPYTRTAVREVEQSRRPAGGAACPDCHRWWDDANDTFIHLIEGCPLRHPEPRRDRRRMPR